MIMQTVKVETTHIRRTKLEHISPENLDAIGCRTNGDRLFLWIAPRQVIVSSCMQSVAGRSLRSSACSLVALVTLFMYTTRLLQWTRNFSCVLGAGESSQYLASDLTPDLTLAFPPRLLVSTSAVTFSKAGAQRSSLMCVPILLFW